MLKFKDFERAEGWEPGSPEVFYKPEVLQSLGAPLVKYDSLQQFFTDDLQIPSDFTTEIILYGTRGTVRDRLYPTVGGSVHLFRPHVMWVNAVVAENQSDYRMKTMGIVAHEGRHMSDRVNEPFKTIGGLTLGARETYEIRAREQQKDPSLIDHQHDISFPDAIANEV